MTTTTKTRRGAYCKRPATNEQIGELRALGYEKLSLVYSYDRAEELLATWREKAQKAREKAEAATRLLNAWERGEDLLRQGYTVSYSDAERLCFVVERPRPVSNPDGPTVAYNVCLSPSGNLPPCDCPDATRHDDQAHVCKHRLAARVAVWQWAQEAEGDYSEFLEATGAAALRRAHEAKKAKETK
jgi:hypothetical protein